MIDLGRITIVLLAAGLSRRFGAEDKLAADVAGKPMAFHIGDTLADMPFGAKFAVCAGDTGTVPEGLRARGFTVVVNAEPERGQGRSLAIGAEAAAARDADAVMVCLADMPFVTRGHLETLAAAFDPREPAVIASQSTHRGPPALFPAHNLADLMALEGDHGARQLLANATFIRTDPHSLFDIDSPADLAASLMKSGQ